MKNRINLLLLKEKNLAERVVYFALNYLRYILVITQICVIGVFFYRFKVDQQIIDLKEELEQKKEIVSVSEPLLKEAKMTDEKIRIIKGILLKQDTSKQMFDYLFSIFPEKLILNELKASEDNFQFTGITSDPVILKVFYDRLNKEKRFETVILKDIQKTPDGFVFAFNLTNFLTKQQ